MKSLVEHALTGGHDRRVDELTAMLRAGGFDDVEAALVRDPFWIVTGRRSPDR